jgi:hypothetical protein
MREHGIEILTPPAPRGPLRNVLPFPVIEVERDGLVTPPREFSSIRRPEPVAA